jgi:hypothetical protein
MLVFATTAVAAQQRISIANQLEKWGCLPYLLKWFFSQVAGGIGKKDAWRQRAVDHQTCRELSSPAPRISITFFWGNEQRYAAIVPDDLHPILVFAPHLYPLLHDFAERFRRQGHIMSATTGRHELRHVDGAGPKLESQTHNLRPLLVVQTRWRETYDDSQVVLDEGLDGVNCAFEKPRYLAKVIVGIRVGTIQADCHTADPSLFETASHSIVDNRSIRCYIDDQLPLNRPLDKLKDVTTYQRLATRESKNQKAGSGEVVYYLQRLIGV